MRVLDLFSGIGGFSLGLERAGMETVAFCEVDPFCRKVLAKHWPSLKIHEDVRSLNGEKYRGTVDVVCGGFPCQPFSLAGKRAGADDDRHLWPEMLRIIREVEPRYVIGENVAGFVNMELDTCLADLEAIGYASGAFIIPACAVDARHRRDRVWILAHTYREGEPDGPNHAERMVENAFCRSRRNAESPNGRRNEEAKWASDSDSATRSSAHVHNPYSASQQGRRLSSGVHAQNPNANSSSDYGRGAAAIKWRPEPRVGRVANGVSRRMDRLKSLGNAVVPQVVEQIGRVIMEDAWVRSNERNMMRSSLI